MSKIFPRGSEWRRWDLHIHTPETKKNDQFDGATVEEKWNNFIDVINESAEDISVVGITDYFCIENYFKFKEHIITGKITKTFDLIVPNIELRIIPVTGSATPINLHCIFNPEIEEEIQTRFLSKLKFDYNGSNYSANKEELIRLGHSLPGNANIKDVDAWHAGIQQYVVSIDSLKEIFKNDSKLRENVIITVSNSTGDGATGVVKHTEFLMPGNQSQLDATRWSIYQFSDAIFSSNDGDVVYFSGNGADTKEVVIEKCKSLMPCFHGCDAHHLDKVFKPDLDRYCWIKADPSFEGLKQTLYEPIGRVRIQFDKPDDKNDYLIIDSIRFIDNDFWGKEILLNQNLNTIIGGKSTGKSILLRNVAKAIDPKEVNNRLIEVGLPDYKKAVSDFEVIWKDKQKSSLTKNEINKRIIYIPQSYLNRLIEKESGSSIEEIVKNILLQETLIKSAFQNLEFAQRNLQKEISKTVDDLFFVLTDWNTQNNKVKQIGDKKGIGEEIAKLEKEVEDLKRRSGLTAEEIDLYNKTQLSIDVLNSQKSAAETTVEWLNQLLAQEPVREMDFSLFIEPLNSELSNKYAELKEALTKDWKAFLNDKKAQAALSIQSAVAKISEHHTGIAEISKKISDASVLDQKIKRLDAEKVKLSQITSEELILDKLAKDYHEKRKALSTLHSQYYDDLHTYKNSILQQTSIKGDIAFNLSVNFRSLAFQKDFIDEVFNLKQISKFTDCDLAEFDYTDQKTFISEVQSIADGILSNTIVLKNNYSKKEAINKLLQNWYFYRYEISQNGDIISDMSPGKKSFVLLKLLIEMDKSNCPILLDQPEDDLDNRSIYEDLVKFIRDKKQNRQFIIVTHNANLVVTADAEEVIVANQHGDKTPNKASKFEYVSGALENTFENDKAESVLLKQGIKEHVCQILEGGKEAFEERKNKYNF